MMVEVTTNLAELDTPALLIDREILEQNLREMQHLADSAGVSLRPHVKTHKSSDLARRQLELGARGIAVAKLSEASRMIEGGITDIQIANQVVGASKIGRLLDLSQKAALSCAIDNLQNAEELSQAFVQAGRKLSVLVEIDTGLHRCGLDSKEQIGGVYARASALGGLSVRGIMTHAGHAYAAKDATEVQSIGVAEGERMAALAAELRSAGMEVGTVSVGSTPTARYSARVKGVTELRVGNYVFNDLIQVALGTVPLVRCALSVLATVISVGSDGRVVIDAGTKALTSEAGAHGSTLVRGFGRIIPGAGATVTRLSEEHGIVESPGRSFRIGDRVRIVPNHACAVVNLFDSASIIDQNGKIEILALDARGCSQ